MQIKNILKNIGYSSVRQALTILRALAIMPFITKLFGSGTYGVWVTIMAIAGLFSTSLGFHLHGALIRFTSKYEREMVVDNVIVLTSIISISVFLSFFLISYVTPNLAWLNLGHLNSQLLAIGIGGVIASNILYLVVVNIPRSNDNIGTYELIQIANVLSSTVVVIVCFYISESVIVALWGTFAQSIVLTSIIGALLVGVPSHFPSLARCKEYLVYGVPMVPKEFSEQLLTSGDRVLLLYFLSPSAAGIYAAAYGIARIFKYASDILNPTLYPLVVDTWDTEEAEQLEEMYRALLQGYILLAIPAAAGLTIMAEDLLFIATTEDIAKNGTSIVSILVIGFLFRALEYPFSYILASANRTKSIGIATVVGAIGNILLNIVAIPILGIAGAAIVTTFSQIFVTLWIYQKTRDYVKLRIPARTIVGATASTIVMIVPVMVIRVSIPLYWRLFLIPPVGTLVYVTLLIATGTINIKKIKYVKSVL